MMILIRFFHTFCATYTILSLRQGLYDYWRDKKKSYAK
jgi:hypothetical protein